MAARTVRLSTLPYAPKFSDPKDGDDARDRKAALIAEKMAIEAELSAKRTDDPVKSAEPVYKAWKKILTERLTGIGHETAFLNSWLRTWNAEYRKNLAAGRDTPSLVADVVNAARVLGDAMDDMKSEIAGLRKTNDDLRAENADLRVRLDRAGSPGAPGAGWDEWREQA